MSYNTRTREFRGAASGLVPAVNDLDSIVRRKGEQNDLVELTRSLAPLGNIAVGPVERTQLVLHDACHQVVLGVPGDEGRDQGVQPAR